VAHLFSLVDWRRTVSMDHKGDMDGRNVLSSRPLTPSAWRNR